MSIGHLPIRLDIGWIYIASSTPYFLHIQDVMAQEGIDLNTYPTNLNNYYLIAYGMLGSQWI